MGFRIEASGMTGQNQVVIEPITDDDPSNEIRRVRIQVKPTVGELPTLPFFPEGRVYTDRLGVKYTILQAQVTEFGSDDGESSMWIYEYLAVIGAYSLTGP